MCEMPNCVSRFVTRVLYINLFTVKRAFLFQVHAKVGHKQLFLYWAQKCFKPALAKNIVFFKVLGFFSQTWRYIQ